jgi:hypothetical protein
MVVEGYRQLDQPLQELFFFRRRYAPDVFQNLVGFKKMALVEKGYSTTKIVGRHALFCHRKLVKKQTSRRSARYPAGASSYRPRIP